LPGASWRPSRSLNRPSGRKAGFSASAFQCVVGGVEAVLRICPACLLLTTGRWRRRQRRSETERGSRAGERSRRQPGPGQCRFGHVGHSVGVVHFSKADISNCNICCPFGGHGSIPGTPRGPCLWRQPSGQSRAQTIAVANRCRGISAKFCAGRVSGRRLIEHSKTPFPNYRRRQQHKTALSFGNPGPPESFIE
jgi:hypothetical protein